MKRTFSPSEAAFEGFRVIQRNPAAIVTWTLLYLVLSFGGLLLVRGVIGSDLAQLSAMGAGQTQSTDPSVAMARMGAVFGHLVPVFLIAGPLGLIVHAIYTTAVYRATIRPDDRGFQYLKFGGDELRQILLGLYMVGVGILAYIGLIIGVVILAAVAAALAKTLGSWVNLIGVLAILALVVAAIWVVLRLSLASAATFARRRVQLFSTWRLTKGNVWRLLGCYLLVLVFVILISVLSWVVSASASAAITGDWSAMTRLHGITDPKAMLQALSVGLVVQTAVAALFGAAIRAVQLAPTAAIYAVLSPDGEGDVKLPEGLVL